MASVTEWPLPVNLPNPNPFYLQYLTPEVNGKIYYTKYIVDFVGELDVTKAKNNIREWKIPQVLFAGNFGDAEGITYGPNGHPWFALERGNRLVELDPASGIFTAFGGKKDFPIPSPRQLMFDQTGALWYTGMGTNGALIGRLNLPRRRGHPLTATFWDLPIELLTPQHLWVESDGKNVWFTSLNPNLVLTGAFLGRINPQAQMLTYWTFLPPRRPANRGIVGEPAANPNNIWFTFTDSNAFRVGGPLSRVFRFNIPNHSFFQYPEKKTSSPSKITIDSSGSAWFSDWTGTIATIPKDADCGHIQFDEVNISWPAIEMEVQSRQQRAIPKSWTSEPAEQAVTPVKDRCDRNYGLPWNGALPEGITVTEIGKGPPQIYFTDIGRNAIGLLRP